MVDQFSGSYGFFNGNFNFERRNFRILISKEVIRENTWNVGKQRDRNETITLNALSWNFEFPNIF